MKDMSTRTKCEELLEEELERCEGVSLKQRTAGQSEGFGENMLSQEFRSLTRKEDPGKKIA